MNYCGQFDHDEHIANQSCCHCGGGSEDFPCMDSDDGDQRDSGSDSCVWYRNQADCPAVGESSSDCACGNFDDDDFSADAMCCQCGGGPDLCIDTNPVDATDLDGRTCADYHYHAGVGGSCENTLGNPDEVDCAGDDC